MSYLSHLVCSECQRTYSSSQIQTYCSNCQAPLLARYDLSSARQALSPAELRCRPKGMWRWAELLPVRLPQNQVTLGEGDTALLAQPLLGRLVGLSAVFVKEESLNPTGSFKARGMASAVSKAGELGIQKLVIPTAGNAGGALAAYAARAGMQARVIMPADAPRANVEECLAAGATVQMVEGLISDAARIAAELASQVGWFDISSFKEPYRLEGKKVLGFEIAESFDWKLPDVIFYPTGGGTGLVGMWKAFEELEQLGWLEADRRPRMVAVQAAGCAPVVKAIENDSPACEFWQGAATYASGLRVPKSFADRLILRCLRDSQGTAVAISDEEIHIAQVEWGKAEGLFVCPEGAATLAAAKNLLACGWLRADEQVLLFNTASGLKYIM